jgi:hypothetical protein
LYDAGNVIVPKHFYGKACQSTEDELRILAFFSKVAVLAPPLSAQRWKEKNNRRITPPNLSFRGGTGTNQTAAKK